MQTMRPPPGNMSYITQIKNQGPTGQKNSCPEISSIMIWESMICPVSATFTYRSDLGGIREVVG